MVGASVILVALAAICWGLSGGIGAILLSHGWDSAQVSFYRGVVGLVFVLSWLLIKPLNSGLSDRRVWLWSAVAGLGVAGNFGFYFISISESGIPVAATLMYCAPIFVYLVSFAIGLERPTRFKVISIALVMIGIGLLTQVYDLEGSQITMLGVATGLLSGLSYALFIFCFKYASSYGSSQSILSIALATLALILVWPSDVMDSRFILDTPDWHLFILLGLIGAGFPFVFYIIGLRHTAPAVASVVAMIEPVTASLFGVLIMGEELAVPQILGIVLILATVSALGIYSNTRHPGYIVWKPWRALKGKLPGHW